MIKIYTNPNSFCHTDIIPEKKNAKPTSDKTATTPPRQVAWSNQFRERKYCIRSMLRDTKVWEINLPWFVSLLAKNNTRLA